MSFSKEIDEINYLKKIRDGFPYPLTTGQVDQVKGLNYNIDILEDRVSEKVYNLASILVRFYDRNGRMVVMLGDKKLDETVDGSYFSSFFKNSQQLNRERVWRKAEELARISIESKTGSNL